MASSTGNGERLRFGQRALEFYRTTAIVFLNTLVVVVVVELLARGILTVPGLKGFIGNLAGLQTDVVAHYQTLPYYVRQNWSSQYWDEFRLALTKRYHPYVTWRSAPFAGETINISRDGTRHTVGAECGGAGTYTVFAFGGSAMWGWGAPDWGTIPTYLNDGLRARHKGAVCVVNFGENAFVSTQSSIQLQVLLASGKIPDAVLFYDGVNDVLAARQTGQPILHQNYAEIATLFEAPRHPLVQWVRGLRTYELLRLAISRSGVLQDGSPQSVSADMLAERTARAYLSNYRTVGALAELYGFDYHFFWQPHILAGSKRLTPEEKRMSTGLNSALDRDRSLVMLFRETYQQIEHEADRREKLHYLAAAFDAAESQIWIDSWGHVTPEGNRLIAQLMLAAMEEDGSRVRQ